MLDFLKTLRDAGSITDEQLMNGNAKFDSVIKPLRIKANKAVELEKFMNENDALKAQIEELKLQNSTPNGEQEAKFKGLENQVKKLTDDLSKERTDKLNAIKRSELSKIVGGINGIDPRYKVLAESRLSDSLKIGENGTPFFERDGVAVDQEDFIKEFVKTNTYMLLPKGQAGGGASGGYTTGGTTINKVALESMSKEEYSKIADDIFSGKITVVQE